jgi:hypothetical protein
MKKLFLVFAVAGFLTACDNAADGDNSTKDSLDSVENAKKEMIDSNAAQAKDSVEQIIDAKKDMVDSLNQGADSVGIN